MWFTTAVRDAQRSEANRANRWCFMSGRFRNARTSQRLIEAFSAITEPLAWLLCRTGVTEQQEMLAKAHRAVQVTGYMTDMELTSLYRRASIFAFPSLDEGFGMPLFEAMCYWHSGNRIKSSAITGSLRRRRDPRRSPAILKRLPVSFAGAPANETRVKITSPGD